MNYNFNVFSVIQIRLESKIHFEIWDRQHHSIMAPVGTDGQKLTFEY